MIINKFLSKMSMLLAIFLIANQSLAQDRRHTQYDILNMALMFASSKGEIEDVKMLIEAGAIQNPEYTYW